MTRLRRESLRSLSISHLLPRMNETLHELLPTLF
jgi:hypothetical protein